MAYTHWYVRMPSDLPVVEPKVETLLELCEQGATLEPTFTSLIVSFHIGIDRYVCGNKSNTMCVSHIPNVAG